MRLRRSAALVLLLIFISSPATLLAQQTQAPAPDPNDPIQRIKDCVPTERAEGKRGRAPPGPFARWLGRSPIHRYEKRSCFKGVGVNFRPMALASTCAVVRKFTPTPLKQRARIAGPSASNRSGMVAS